MPEKTHSNQQVTIDHSEYQELLEAEKALAVLAKAIDMLKEIHVNLIKPK